MMRRYPAYKDSGVEWLGEVPEGWTVVNIKRVASIKYGIGEPPPYRGEGVPLIRATNVDSGKIVADGVVFIDPADIPANRITWLSPGDIVVVRSGAYTGDSAIIEPNHCPAIAGFDMVLKPVNVHPSFLGFLLLSSEVKQGQIDLEKMRAAQPHLNAEEIGSCIIPLPSLPEQTAIAAFLDRETAKIDVLVAEQRRLIELLREKRQAVISHAVTKGLNPDAPLKPSGIDWLGDVPEGWSPIPIRKVARLESGHTPSRSRPDWWEDCTIPWFTLADIWQVRSGEREYVHETSELVSELGLANSSARLLPAGTVMLSRTASVGYSAIMGVDMATTQDFANWVCGPRLLPEFLLFCLRGMPGEFGRLKMGSTHNTIYMPDIQALCIALPPVEEQRTIVAFVRNELSKFRELTATAETAITLLQERRAALISAAVTGKIDVRDMAGADQRGAA